MKHRKLSLCMLALSATLACSPAPKEESSPISSPSPQVLVDNSRLDIYHVVELNADLSPYSQSQRKMLGLLSL